MILSSLLSEATNRALHEDEFKNVFISGLSRAWENVAQLFESVTSDFPGVQISALPALSPEIRNHLANLRQDSANERGLYEIADAVAEWIANASDSEQAVLATYLQELPARSARILLSAFADGEVHLKSEQLLWTIARFLASEDERLAQAAAVCLLQCGDALGRRFLLERMAETESLPHAHFIQDVIELLTAKSYETES